MGTYLVTGILQNICIRKKDIPTKISIDNIKSGLQEDINLNHYIYQENEQEIFWSIKPSMLENNLEGFLEKQFNLYRLKQEEILKVLEEIKKNKSGEERIQLAERRSLYNFQTTHC